MLAQSRFLIAYHLSILIGLCLVSQTGFTQTKMVSLALTADSTCQKRVDLYSNHHLHVKYGYLNDDVNIQFSDALSENEYASNVYAAPLFAYDMNQEPLMRVVINDYKHKHNADQMRYQFALGFASFVEDIKHKTLLIAYLKYDQNKADWQLRFTQKKPDEPVSKRQLVNPAITDKFQLKYLNCTIDYDHTYKPDSDIHVKCSC